MHKLKQAFGKKETSNPTNDATGETVQPERRRSSIMRQILNPGGNKYEEEIHGTTSTATPDVPQPAELKTDPAVKLHEDPELRNKKEHGVLKQILNPNGDKFDEQRHGITTVPTNEAFKPGELVTDKDKDHHDKKAHGIKRQLLNPHGEKYDEESFGTTAHAVRTDEPEITTEGASTTA